MTAENWVFLVVGGIIATNLLGRPLPRLVASVLSWVIFTAALAIDFDWFRLIVWLAWPLFISDDWIRWAKGRRSKVQTLYMIRAIRQNAVSFDVAHDHWKALPPWRQLHLRWTTK